MTMPIKRKLMRNLIEEYGKEKGTRIYYQMENTPKYWKLFKRGD